MSQPVFDSPKPVTSLLMSLASTIEQTFTPFAFTCDCGGLEPSCKRIIEEDRYAIGQLHTVQRIADFIRKIAQ